MDSFKKYIKYKSKYQNLKSIIKGTHSGNIRAINFSSNILKGMYWKKILFSHGAFIRNVCIALLGNNFEIIENKKIYQYKIINKDNNLTIDIFSGIPKSNLAKCSTNDEKLEEKFKKKINKKDYLYRFIGNGSIVRISIENNFLYFVRHFPSKSNLADVTKKGSKFVSNPELISGECFDTFLNKYKYYFKIFTNSNNYLIEEFNEILKNNIVYTSCLKRTIQTAKILIYQVLNHPIFIKYCILEGIHEIGKWDIANKCPNNTVFGCFDLK